jgi:hypothetical protein
MTLRVVGAGLGRTGTHSLKLALEQLLGAPCYHMVEVFGRPDDIPRWADAADGEPVDWNALMHGYTAAVDWPAAAFWSELADEFPGAIVLLSTRASADAWWKSANDTIFQVVAREPPPDPVGRAQIMMIRRLLERRFTPDWSDATAAKRAYEQHNETVRAHVPRDRLGEWQGGDGWEPICAALGLPVPDAAFPHVNTTDDFRTMAGLD